MWHPFPGFTGAFVGPLVLIGIGTASYVTKEFEDYNLDPKARPGAFEPFLAKYIRAAEFIIGLATGSIILLVGSSTLHSQGGRLPWHCVTAFSFSSAVLIWGLIHHDDASGNENGKRGASDPSDGTLRG